MRPPQFVQLPFTGGVDQRLADEYQDPSSRLLDAQNVVWTKEGAAQKRPGVQGLASSQVPGDPTMGAPARLITRGKQLLAHDGDKLFAYGSGAQVWSFRGLASPCVATRETLAGNLSVLASTAQMAEGGGFRAEVYVDSSGANSNGNVFVNLYDATNNAPIQLGYQLTVGSTFYSPLPVIIGTNLYVFYSSYAGAIYGAVLNLTTLTWTAAVAIVSDALPNGNGFIFDAVPEVGGSGIVLVYAQAGTGSTSSPRVLRLEALPALTISASFILINYSGTATTTLVCARYDGALGVVWFGWESNTAGTFAMSASVWSLPGWTLTASANVTVPGRNATITAFAMAVEPSSATTMQIVAGANTASGFPTAGATYAISGGSLTQTSTASYPRGSIVTRPFRVNCGATQRMVALFGLTETIQANGTTFGSYLVIDTASGRPLATVAPRQAGGATGTLNPLVVRRFPVFTNPASPSAGTYRAPITVVATEEFGPNFNGSQVYFVQLLTLDFTGATAWQGAEGGTESFLSGGMPGYYDGAGLQELGFLEWPTGVTNSVNTSTGGQSTGTYGYAVCYAQMDAAGFIHRSATWTGGVTIGPSVTNATVTLTIPNLAWTSRYQAGALPPVALVFRTTNNGATYYFVGSVACVPNSPAATLSFVDGLSDSNITTNTLVYTTGGVLDSVCPPSLRSLISHNGRLWGIDDTGFVVWYTTPFNASDAPYFNEGLTLQFTEGPLTALATMDDKLVVFTGSRIKFLAGDGPANTGQGSDLTNPVVVMTDVGASDWRSVVTTPRGVMFQAPSGGIYMLGRDLEVSFVGKSVQDWVGTTPVVSAVLVPGTQQVRFLLQGGSVVAFDYVLGRWSRHVYGQTFTTQAVPPNAAAPTYYAAGAGGAYREKTGGDSAPYLDANAAGVTSWVTLLLQTAWVKLGGLQGDVQLGHVFGYGKALDPCDVKVTLGFDYGVATQGPETYQFSKLTVANASASQWDAMVAAQNTGAMAVQVTLSDAPPTGGSATTGQGLRWLGVAFDLQQLTDRKSNLAVGVKQ